MKFIKSLQSKFTSPHYQRMRLFNAIFSSALFFLFLVLAGPGKLWVWIPGVLGLGSGAYYAYIRWRSKKRDDQ
jgi:hypothetical protein